MFWTWLRTVAGLTWSRSAIPWVLAPVATSSRISISRRVKTSPDAGPAAGGASRSWTRVSSSLVAVTSRKRCTVSGPPVPPTGTASVLTLIQTGRPLLLRVRMSKLCTESPIFTRVMTWQPR